MVFDAVTMKMPNLKKLMKEKNVSCMELALTSGVCFATIINARKGKPVMGYTVDAIIEALNTRSMKKRYVRGNPK